MADVWLCLHMPRLRPTLATSRSPRSSSTPIITSFATITATTSTASHSYPTTATTLTVTRFTTPIANLTARHASTIHASITAAVSTLPSPTAVPDTYCPATQLSTLSTAPAPASIAAAITATCAADAMCHVYRRALLSRGHRHPAALRRGLLLKCH